MNRSIAGRGSSPSCSSPVRCSSSSRAGSEEWFGQASGTAPQAMPLIVSRADIFENDSAACPFGGHSPSNSTGGEGPPSVPSRDAQHVRVVSRVPLRKLPNRSIRFERVVSESPRSPTLQDQLAGLCVDLAVHHVPRRRRLLWAYRRFLGGRRSRRNPSLTHRPA
jgi:hypothetical protein